jgi:hypothetical protein
MSKKRKWLFALVMASALVVATGGSALYAAGGGGDNGVVATGIQSGQDVAVRCAGTQTKQAYANHDDQNGTTSTTFVNIPGARVPFTVSTRGGAKCVSVLFTSMAFVAPGSSELLGVRALLDGAVAGNPSETQFEAASPSGYAVSHAMNFTFSAVAPGAHTIRMQFRSFNGGPVFIHRGTTIVLYA